MSAGEGWHWAYRLLAPAAGVRSPAVPRGQTLTAKALRAGFVSERQLRSRGLADVAPWLLQLDQQGLLARELRVGRRAWARVLPQRAPATTPPLTLPKGVLRLASTTMLHPGDEGLIVEAPGAWARLQLLGSQLPALLQALARGCSLKEAQATQPGAAACVQELLLAMHGCSLLGSVEQDEAWAAHDLWLHSRTRRGFGRDAIGKVGAAAGADTAWTAGPRTVLAKGRPGELGMSLAGALERRRSLREHATGPLPLQGLARLLWHALAAQEQGGRWRRPYPSGGACYALRPLVLVSHCAGLRAGLYAYDAQTHELVRQPAEPAALRHLLRDAAASAQCAAEPQALLLLCADYARMRSAYGDLAYSLLLKEVGAAMQTLQLVATALGLACCPLGTGDALVLAQLTGLSPLRLPSVGELLIGVPA